MTRRFEKADVAAFIKCDVHPWEGAYAAVFDHPFFAVTDAEGAFTLPKLNPGEYEIEVWHEKYGSQTKKVVVKASGTETVDLAFKVK